MTGDETTAAGVDQAQSVAKSVSRCSHNNNNNSHRSVLTQFDHVASIKSPTPSRNNKLQQQRAASVIKTNGGAAISVRARGFKDN